MKAAELIDCQADLVWRLTGQPDGTREGSAPLYDYVVGIAARELSDKVGPAIAALSAEAMSSARCYRVQENMTAEIIRRSDLLTDDAPIGRDGLAPPRPAGLVRLEEPLIFDEVRGRQQIVYWISWAGFQSAPEVGAPPQRAWAITVWGDAHDQPDEVLRTIWEEDRRGRDTAQANHARFFGRWAPVTVGYLSDGLPVGPKWVTDAKRMADVRRRLAMDGKTLDTPAIHNPVRWIVALWALLGETVPGGDVERTDEHVPRTTAKRARRDGVEEPAVTTVVLRRQSRPVINPGSGTPMSSRIEIDAYEAWRWIGSTKDGTRRRVRRTVARHWSSNDESLPVRERKIVSELRR